MQELDQADLSSGLTAAALAGQAQGFAMMLRGLCCGAGSGQCHEALANIAQSFINLQLVTSLSADPLPMAAHTKPVPSFPSTQGTCSSEAMVSSRVAMQQVSMLALAIPMPKRPAKDAAFSSLIHSVASNGPFACLYVPLIYSIRKA